MTYEELVKKAKQIVKKIDASEIAEHMAIEFDIEGEGEGAFYVELDTGKAEVEPYEYYDSDCNVRMDAEALTELLAGKLDVSSAIDDEYITVEGDAGKLEAFAEVLKAIPVKKAVSSDKKPAAKKPTAKKPVAKKATAKKLEVKK